MTMLHDKAVRSTIFMDFSLKKEICLIQQITEARVTNPNQPVKGHGREKGFKKAPYSNLIATAGSSLMANLAGTKPEMIPENTPVAMAAMTARMYN